MTRPVGEKFKYNGVWYVVREDKAGTVCRDCAFRDLCKVHKRKEHERYLVTGYCSSFCREDKKFVHFERV